MGQQLLAWDPNCDLQEDYVHRSRGNKLWNSLYELWRVNEVACGDRDSIPSGGDQLRLLAGQVRICKMVEPYTRLRM